MIPNQRSVLILCSLTLLLCACPIIPPQPFVVLEQPRAADNGRALIGRCIRDGAIGPYATNRIPTLTLVEDRGLDKYTAIYRGAVNGNLKVGVVNTIAGRIGGGFSSKSTFELRDIKIVLPPNDIYDIPFGRCSKVITGAVVAGTLVIVTNQGANATLGVELESVLKGLTDDSGVGVSFRNNQYEASFGKGLAIGVEVGQVDRVLNERTWANANMLMGEEITFPAQGAGGTSSGISDVEYFLSTDQVLNVDPGGYDGLISNPSGVYCLSIEVAGTDLAASDVTYCPKRTELIGTPVEGYAPNRVYTDSSEIPALRYLEGEDIMVQTYITLERPRFVISESDPTQISEAIAKVTFTERRLAVRRSTTLD